MQFQDTQQTPIQNPNYPSYNPHYYTNQSHHMKSSLLSPVDAAPANHHDHIHSDDDDEPQKQQKDSATAVAAEAFVHKSEPEKEEEEKRSSGGPRERLKRHRVELASSSDGVWIPDIWGQEGFLKDWIDCATFDASLVAATIANARDSLMEESKRIRRSSAILPSSAINNSSSNNNNNNNSPSRVLLKVNSSS